MVMMTAKKMKTTKKDWRVWWLRQRRQCDDNDESDSNTQDKSEIRSGNVPIRRKTTTFTSDIDQINDRFAPTNPLRLTETESGDNTTGEDSQQQRSVRIKESADPTVDYENFELDEDIDSENLISDEEDDNESGFLSQI